jgi:hypothetical protein
LGFLILGKFPFYKGVLGEGIMVGQFLMQLQGQQFWEDFPSCIRLVIDEVLFKARPFSVV